MDDRAPKSPSSSDVMSLKLSPHHSLDIVRLPKPRKYRIVFAERFGVQRRAFVEVSFDEAIRLARFLVSVDNFLDDQDDPKEATDPGRAPPSAILKDPDLDSIELPTMSNADALTLRMHSAEPHPPLGPDETTPVPFPVLRDLERSQVVGRPPNPAISTSYHVHRPLPDEPPPLPPIPPTRKPRP